MANHTDDDLDLLVDPDPSVRLATVMQMGEERRAEAAAPLVERFGRERDFQVREVLTWATLRLGEPAVPLVRDALASPRWLARLQATHTLSKLGRTDDGVRLLPVVDDPVDCVAARAWWAAARCGDPTTLPALVGQLGRGTAEDRNSLLVALSQLDDVVPPLVQALATGATADVRQQAADVLAYLEPAEIGAAETVVRGALADEAEAVRLAAMNALGQLRTPAARDAIAAFAEVEGPLGALARRLLARDVGRWDAPSTPQVLPADGDPVGRRWPTPDPALVELTDSPLGERLRPMLAMQVAVCRPSWRTRADVPAEVLAGVRDRAERAAVAAGRSPGRAARIAAGRVELFHHEHVFHEQVSVADPGRTIDGLLFGTEVEILAFARPEGPTPSA